MTLRINFGMENDIKAYKRKEWAHNDYSAENHGKQ